jgi:GT2 family glycosyltransferase
MDLSIIIVSWNVKESLRSNLRALQASSGALTLEIFVVDNNSSDGSAAMVREEFPAVRLLANSENLGFAKANNQALRLATGDFILLFNPDMMVQTDTLENLWRWSASHPEATVVSGRLLSPSGENIRHVRRFPKFLDQLLIVLKVPHFWPAVLNRYLCRDFDYQKAARVDSVRGSFFLINRAAYKRISAATGIDVAEPFLDERYFLWFEEVDFCRQVYQSGGEVWYTPAATAIDQVGQSFKQVKTRQAQAYFSASMLAYFKKWEPAWQSWFLSLTWRLVKALLYIRI